eukprot:m.284838 g.284838  ORF g.284838 m.284838 type:complete len:56 (+) comp22914_c0_seq8:166-333(+)
MAAAIAFIRSQNREAVKPNTHQKNIGERPAPCRKKNFFVIEKKWGKIAKNNTRTN